MEATMNRFLRVSLLFLLLSPALYAQRVFSVPYESQADVKVFVAEYESEADLKVYKVQYESQTGKNNGRWFFTEYASQAEKQIFFVEYKSQADVVIFYVRHESQAGWRTEAKMHFFDSEDDSDPMNAPKI
jgi:hypothetical protein